MVTSEFEERLETLTDAELLRQAIKCLRAVYKELEHVSGAEEAQEQLDYIYMECSKRGKEWIFDKAQDACIRQNGASAPISMADVESA